MTSARLIALRSFPGPWPVILAAVLGVGCEKATLAPLVPLSRIEISPGVDTLGVGEIVQFTAAAFDTLGNLTGEVRFTWTSGDPAIFTVSSQGRVLGVGEGTAQLMVEAGGHSDVAQVTVFPDTGWFVQPSGTAASLNGVHFLPDGRSGWAVGDGGTIVHTADAGVTWARQVSNTSFNLNDVWFTSATHGWAVGKSGTILRTTDGGLRWSRLNNVGRSEALRDVTFATRDTGWVAGDNGLTLRTFDGGATWQVTRIPTSFPLHGLSFAGTRDGWAVGGGGVIAGTHDRGVTWFVVPPITIQPIHAVWRRGEAVAFAVGALGVSPRTVAGPDSTLWELRNAGSTRQLDGVHYPTDRIGYAVGFDAGLGGTVLRTDDGGVTWEAQASRTGAPLRDVFFVDALRGWAVGQGGTIIHTARGGRR